MSSEFRKDELVVFVGHSSDAQAEAEVIKKMESTFQEELRTQTRIAENPPFRSVKVWEWSLDAEGKPGGQCELIDRVIDTAHIAVFVFKERVGGVTRAELERCREPSERRVSIYAVFPTHAPEGEKLSQEATAVDWADLLSYKRSLSADWTKPDGEAIRPLKDYGDHEELEMIVLEQFRRDLGAVLGRRAERLEPRRFGRLEIARSSSRRGVGDFRLREPEPPGRGRFQIAGSPSHRGLDDLRMPGA